MKIHQLSSEEALARLRSAPLGLSSDEAERRLLEYGPNVVQELAREPAWLRLVREFIQFFSLILWAAAGLAFVAEWSDPGQGMAKIGYAIVMVILVSGLFSFWQEYRVERTLAALRRLLPQKVKVTRGGRVILGSAEQLVPGDIVLLEQVTTSLRIAGCSRHSTFGSTTPQSRASPCPWCARQLLPTPMS